MTNRLAMVYGLSVLGATHPLRAADGVYEKGPKQSFEVTNTERVPFAPGGTIRLNNSYGYLTVEGWDEPEVEITVTKSTDRFYEPSRQQAAAQALEQVRVVTERRSDKELAISTMIPGQPSLSPKCEARRHGRVQDPCAARLAAGSPPRHGYVWVSDVTGDIECAATPET